MTKGELKEPFFAYINFTVTHESQVRAAEGEVREEHRPPEAGRAPRPGEGAAAAVLSRTPRKCGKNVATYHDNITAMDYQVGDVLKWLDDKKLADNTVVVLLRRPRLGHVARQALAVRQRHCGPRSSSAGRGTIKPGTVRDDLVAFIDFAPTRPDARRGQGRRSGCRASRSSANGVKERKYVFAARDRMDETFDRIRAVRDKRFKYIRNFYPELPYAQTHPLHGRDADHEGLAAARGRGQADRPAEALLRADQAEGRTVRHRRRPARGQEPRRRPGARGQAEGAAGGASTSG